jgi:hypothetical protein
MGRWQGRWQWRWRIDRNNHNHSGRRGWRQWAAGGARRSRRLPRPPSGAGGNQNPGLFDSARRSRRLCCKAEVTHKKPRLQDYWRRVFSMGAGSPWAISKARIMDQSREKQPSLTRIVVCICTRGRPGWLQRYAGGPSTIIARLPASDCVRAARAAPPWPLCGPA